jgi:hypothetical protein
MASTALLGSGASTKLVLDVNGFLAFCTRLVDTRARKSLDDDNLNKTSHLAPGHLAPSHLVPLKRKWL